ncbi:MAG: DUF6538 domain-containing protein [Pseudomonadota bacterium]
MTKFLTKRGDTYYFKRRVPQDLHEVVGKNVWKESLRTGDRLEAEIRCRSTAVTKDKLIRTLRETEKSKQPDSSSEMYMDEAGNLMLASSHPYFVHRRSGRSLSDMFDEYVENSSLATSSEEAFRLGVLRFVQVCGDKDVVFVDRYDAEKFRDILRRIPVRPPDNIRSMKVIDQADWADVHDVKRLAQSTVTRNMLGVSLTLDYAFEQTAAFRDRKWTNPFAGFLTRGKKAQRDKRVRFSEEQINLVFSKAVYTTANTAARFWIPLLLLYTGARLDEVAQTLINEVKLSPIPHLDFDSSEERTGKTEAARRYIPIHNDLIELGFIKYVEAARRRGDFWLFPELSHERGKERASKISQHFMRSYRKYGTDKPSTGLANTKITTHSLRHRFEHIALKSGVPLWQVDLFVGHHVGEVGVSVYADELKRDAEALKNMVLDQVPFPDVMWMKVLAEQFYR